MQNIEYQLPVNLTYDSIILNTVQLSVKNHLILDVSSDTYTESVVTENESMHSNIELTNQIKICYYMKQMVLNLEQNILLV